MKLDVIGKPTVTPTGEQTLTVRYCLKHEYTIIDCNTDIVTLGIAVQVLQQKYNEALESLNNPILAKNISETIERAVKNCERNRGKNSKPR